MTFQGGSRFWGQESVGEWSKVLIPDGIWTKSYKVRGLLYLAYCRNGSKTGKRLDQTSLLRGMRGRNDDFEAFLLWGFGAEFACF